MIDPSRETIWNVPNLLTLSRLPLTALLCWAIAAGAWWVAFALFVVASLSDALDGWWARRFNQFTAFGRVFDPLIDKVMIGGAFIFLIPVPLSGLAPWMVTLVVGRELLITGVRGYVESLGKKFGADWFGKLKMILQCLTLGAILLALAVRPGLEDGSAALKLLEGGQALLIWAMLAATVGSGVQYCWRAGQLLRAG